MDLFNVLLRPLGISMRHYANFIPLI